MRKPKDAFRVEVCNQSARQAPKPCLIVMHATEGTNLAGIQDLKNLASWFDNPSAQASAHIGIDAAGNSAQFVSPWRKAWHCASFNSASLGIELVGKTSQSIWPDRQYRKAARYVAYWSKRYRIPLRVGYGDGTTGRVIRSGVVTHRSLGDKGGNHGDPGSGFRMKKLLWLARFYRARGW